MDKFNKLKPEQKLLVAVLSLGMVAGLYYYSMIMDIDTELVTINSRIESKTRELSEHKEKNIAQQLEIIQQEYAEVLKQVDENKKILPVDDNIAEFIHSLETDAEEARVQIITYEPGKKLKHDYYDEIPIQMEVRGTFTQLVHFFKLVSEPQKRLVNINALEIQNIDDRRRREERRGFLGLGSGPGRQENILVSKFTASTFTYTGLGADSE